MGTLLAAASGPYGALEMPVSMLFRFAALIAGAELSTHVVEAYGICPVTPYVAGVRVSEPPVEITEEREPAAARPKAGPLDGYSVAPGNSVDRG